MLLVEGVAFENQGNDVCVNDQSSGLMTRLPVHPELAQELEEFIGAFGIMLGESEKILPVNRRLQHELLPGDRLFLS